MHIFCCCGMNREDKKELENYRNKKKKKELETYSLCMVGSTGVGKSTITSKYIGNPTIFKNESTIRETYNIDKHIKLTGQNETIHVIVEDTAGQEVRSAVPCGGRCRLSLPQVNKVAVVETVAGLKLVFDQKQDQKQHGKNCPRPDTVFI